MDATRHFEFGWPVRANGLVAVEVPRRRWSAPDDRELLTACASNLSCSRRALPTSVDSYSTPRRVLGSTTAYL